MSLYLGIDLGTSGCRGVVIDDDGQPHADSQTPLSQPSCHGNCVEQAPELWWETVLATLDRLIPAVPARDIRAIAVDGTSATLLLSDGKGRPLSPGLMYNDARGREEALRIAALAGETSGFTSDPERYHG